MKAVVGLGNPGSKYERTRHNVGYEVLAALAGRHGGGKPSEKFEAEVVEVFIAGEKVVLVAPLTFMNLSGRSVRRVVDFFDLSTEDLVVVCDDMNLDVGRLRLRSSGSAGGQKGVKDVILQLGTESFPRLRIGIGRPPGRMDAADYVLGRFDKDDREAIDHAVVRAADAVEMWIREGVDSTMNRLNAPADADA